jgi:DNA-binding NtrC family response regulator
MAAVITPLSPVRDSARTEHRSRLRLVEPRARVLSISASQADHTALYRMIDTSRWRFAAARTCSEAVWKLSSNGARVVFCADRLPDGDWKHILAHLAGSNDPPRFAVVSPMPDELLWFEVLERGGYDVLSKPLVEEEVRSVLESAERLLRRAHPTVLRMPDRR